MLLMAGREEIDVDHAGFIDAANPSFYLVSVLLIFFTLLSLRYHCLILPTFPCSFPFLSLCSWPLVVLWSCGFGVLGAYLLFR